MFLFALPLLASALVISGAPGVTRSGTVSRSDKAPDATAAGPHFVLYSDKYVSTAPPNASEIAGYNVFALSFLLTSGAADNALVWEQLTADQRSAIKADYAAAGISLIVSAFGSTDVPTSSGLDPIDTADTVATWVTTYDVDGVDIDYEDFDAFEDPTTTTAVAWLGNFTTALRAALPKPYIITHAPVAPWFSPNVWPENGYLAIDKAVGDSIDWYNIQFYNQGTTEYTTCDGLLNNSSAKWPESALFQIAANGVSQDKLVVGKPATTTDANNGYIAPAALASCMETATQMGWNAGVMVWEYPDAASTWIEEVRANAWPLSGTNGTSPTVSVSATSASLSSVVSTASTSSTPTPTITSSATATSSITTSTATSSVSVTCASASPWQAGIVYTAGESVTYNGYLWTANYWTENDTPNSTIGDWTHGGACSGAPATAAH